MRESANLANLNYLISSGESYVDNANTGWTGFDLNTGYRPMIKL